MNKLVHCAADTTVHPHLVSKCMNALVHCVSDTTVQPHPTKKRENLIAHCAHDAPVLFHLLCREILDVSLAFLYQIHSTIVQRLEIV